MNLLDAVAERILVGDGAIGTELIRLGAPAGTPGDLLNLDTPELVERVHRGYVEAGSDVIITNTFGATSLKLEKHGASGKVRAINLAAARLARKAAGDRVIVAGDIGPSGAMLKPYGPAEPKTVRDAFVEQANALKEGGVDAIILETFFDLAEAGLALEAAVATGLPVIASMTFDVKPNGVFTMMGNRAADCAKELAAGGAAVVGANCTVTIDGMVEVARALAEGTAVPLIVQPNAGQPQVVDGGTVYGETPEHFASRIPELLEAGARIVGGCCGTGPRFVKAIRETLPVQ